MKTLELNLNKRLLILESDNETQARIYGYNKYGVLGIKYICKGPELTEDIAKGFVCFVGGPWSAYVDYNNEKNWISTALQSFISAIESKGWYWGKHPNSNLPELNVTDFGRWYNDKSTKEYESKTFNPEKCLIFEIL